MHKNLSLCIYLRQIWEITPSDKKIGRTTFFWVLRLYLVYTCISCIHLYILHTLVYLAYTCISCIHLYILYTLVYLVYICISCIHLYILYTLVYLVFTCYRFLNGFYLYLKHNYILKNTYHYCITYLVIYI
jgi:hypothetical protein